MKPPDLIIAVLGNGPATETALVAHAMRHGYPYEAAVLSVKNALVDLLLAKRIEHIPGHSIYRLTEAFARMEKPCPGR